MMKLHGRFPMGAVQNATFHPTDHLSSYSKVTLMDIATMIVTLTLPLLSIGSHAPGSCSCCFWWHNSKDLLRRFELRLLQFEVVVQCWLETKLGWCSRLSGWHPILRGFLFWVVLHTLSAVLEDLGDRLGGLKGREYSSGCGIVMCCEASYGFYRVRSSVLVICRMTTPMLPPL